MNAKRKAGLEHKVGWFVLFGLALLAALILSFSKGLTFFRSIYTIKLHAANAGGLKERAVVLMSGVQVGTVYDIVLAPEGTNVTIALRIYSRYTIHKPARFLIEQSGFLGDQYVSILPLSQGPECYKDGDTSVAEEPFDLQEVARSAVGFINRIDRTARDLDEAIAQIRREVLNDRTLTNLAIAVGNVRQVSERALLAVDGINALIETNAPALSGVGTNLEAFSLQLNGFAGGLTEALQTNSIGISASVKNVETSTEALKGIVADIQAGKGPAGVVLKDQELARHIEEIAANLSVASSNLNRLGLWKFLWHHETPRSDAPPGKKHDPAPISPHQ